MKRLLIGLCILVSPLAASTKVLVTVIEPKSGAVVADLKAADFTLFDNKTPRRIESAEFVRQTADIMMLLDTSLMGEMVRPVAENLIAQLRPKELMAIVSFHSSADLIQDFTSSHSLLSRAVSSVKYGNSPRVLDALYASIDTGFQNSIYRRAILLLTAGVEGDSRVSEREVIRLARRNGVSIFPVYVIGYDKSLLENLARQTGGASFNLRDMKKALGNEPPGPTIFSVLRSHYTLTIPGNLSLGEKVKVEVRRQGKLFVSTLPLD